MSMDRDVNVNLKVNPDPQLQQKLNQTTGQVRAELVKLGQVDALENLAKDADKLAANTNKASEAAKTLAGNVSKTQTAGAVPTPGATAGAGISASGAAGAGISASGAAGALGAAGGLAGSLGGSAAVGQAGSAVGLLGSNIAALGPIGVATTAVTVGLGVAMKALSEASEKARAEVTRYNELVRDRLELEYQTTDELVKAREARQREVDILKEQIAQAATVEEPTQFKDFAIRDNLYVIGDALGLVGAAGDQAASDLADMEEKLAKAEGELVNVNDALESTEVAANDAAKAMQDLAEQMAQELLDSASDAGEAVRELAAAQDRSRDANQKRLEQIADEQAAAQAELEILQSQATQSEEVARRIDTLNEKLSDLGQEAAIVSDVMSKQSRETNEVSRSAGRAATETQSVGLRIGGMTKKFKDALDEQLKTAIEFANKVDDIEYDAAKQREKIAIDANREQERLIRESKQQFNLDFYQDFLGEFQRRQQLAFNVSETQIGVGQSFADVDRNSFNAQQQLRAQTQGAQQLANQNTFNISGDPQSIMQVLQSAGVVV